MAFWINLTRWCPADLGLPVRADPVDACNGIIPASPWLRAASATGATGGTVGNVASSGAACTIPTVVTD